MELNKLRQDRVRILRTLKEKEDQHRGVLRKKQELLDSLKKRATTKERELVLKATAEQKSNTVLRQRNVLLEAKVRMLREQQQRRIDSRRAVRAPEEVEVSAPSGTPAHFEQLVDQLTEAAAAQDLRETQAEQVRAELKELAEKEAAAARSVASLQEEIAALGMDEPSRTGAQLRRLDEARYRRRVDWSLQDAMDQVDSIRAQLGHKRHQLNDLEHGAAPDQSTDLTTAACKCPEAAAAVLIGRLTLETRARRRFERQCAMLARTAKDQQGLLAESQRALQRQQLEYDKHVLELSGIHNTQKQVLLEQLDDLAAQNVARQNAEPRDRFAAVRMPLVPPTAPVRSQSEDSPRERVLRRHPSPSPTSSTVATEREVDRTKKQNVFVRLQRDSTRREKDTRAQDATTKTEADATPSTSNHGWTEVFRSQLRGGEERSGEATTRRERRGTDSVLYDTAEREAADYSAVGQVEEAHAHPLTACCFADALLVTAATDLKCWDVTPSGVREVASVVCPGRKSVRSLAADGTRVAACSNTVRLLDARTFAPAGQLPEAAAAAAFLGDNIAVAGKDDEGAYVRVYDLRKAGARSEPLFQLDVGKTEPSVLCRLDQGLVVGSHDKKVRVWLDIRDDAPASRVLAPPHYDQITALATARRRDGDPIVLTASKDRHLRGWTLPSRSSLASAAHVQAHHDVVTAVAYVPARDHAVSAGRDGTIRFWTLDDTPKLKLEPSSERYLARHSAAPVSGLCARGDGFVSVSHDKTLKLWRPTERE